MLIAGGYWHSAVQTHPILMERIDAGAAMTQGHREIVTCVAATADGSIVVSGSRDCTCTVWLLSGKAELRDEYMDLVSVAPSASGDTAVLSSSTAAQPPPRSIARSLERGGG